MEKTFTQKEFVPNPFLGQSDGFKNVVFHYCCCGKKSISQIEKKRVIQKQSYSD